MRPPAQQQHHSTREARAMAARRGLVVALHARGVVRLGREGNFMAGTNWDRNSVGPYTVLRKLRSVASTEVGRLYAALRGSTGVRALVVAPTHETHFFPSSEWQVRVRASAGESPYMALEVEKAPTGKRALRELADGLEYLADSLDCVEKHPEAERHLLARPTPPARRSWWKAATPYWAALTVAGIAALVLNGRTPEAGIRASETGVSAAIADEGLAEPVALPVSSLDFEPTGPVVGLDMPKKPFERQRLAPCDEAETEVQLKNGAHTCWIGVTFTAKQCKTRGYEWEGKCLLPSIPAPRTPSSTRPDTEPMVPAGH